MVGAMTYNFDPERWYEIQQAALEGRLQRGEIDAKEAGEKRAEIERRYEAMLDRLDGTYSITE